MRTPPFFPVILLGIVGILGAVFTLYGASDFVVLLANQVWACF